MYEDMYEMYEICSRSTMVWTDILLGYCTQMNYDRNFRIFSFRDRCVSRASKRQVEDSDPLSACCWTHKSWTINHRCSFLQRASFRNFQIMETIPNQPNSCPKTCGRSSKNYDPYTT
ncbi:hypothetical protein CDAR_502081 [Caerostris darwini]|uniref:Uncharacterized protein n=1 Tax=Caerostris darwini TaxID=1538125 RepID=A0AAV4VVW6_9ARAC|nr:hypothetical protein CDAR_502081 [Caerostris darwini]